MSLNQELIKKFQKNLSNNIKLSNYSWFNLGGPAEYLFKPKNKEQLIEFLKENKKSELKITILGAGSNTLIRDNGVKGVVIKLGKGFSDVKLTNNKDIIEAGAGALDRKISNYAKENLIGNLEFLSCIPGSIGGAVMMNSGCYNNDISKVLISVKVIDINDCQEKEIKREEIEFYYRGTSLPKNLIITSVKLKGKISSKEAIETKQTELIEKEKNCHNPAKSKHVEALLRIQIKEKKAWELIKESGCDEFKEGEAEISKTHCNFFVNNGKAKSADIEKLIEKVKKTVNEKIWHRTRIGN